MSKMELPSRLIPSEGIVAQKLDNEIVLLDLNSSQYLGLNEVGARVWTLINEGRELDAIKSMLTQEYDVEAAALAADVDALIRSMIDVGIVVAEG